MTASPVVDLDVWRERARIVRGADSSAAAAPASAPAATPSGDGASVIRMPAPAAPAGPVSPFGPVMAFGLVRRSAPEGGAAAALQRAVHLQRALSEPDSACDPAGGPDAARREAPVGPPVLTVLPQLSAEPATSSAPVPRLRSVLDTRGTPRGPRR